MVLGNYVILQDGVPKRMHFTAHRITEIERVDPLTGRPGKVRALVFDVDEEDGLAVSKIYSTLSEKHARDLEPYLKDLEYTRRTFIITKRGSGHLTQYTLQAPLR